MKKHLLSFATYAACVLVGADLPGLWRTDPFKAGCGILMIILLACAGSSIAGGEWDEFL